MESFVLKTNIIVWVIQSSENTKFVKTTTNNPGKFALEVII